MHARGRMTGMTRVATARVPARRNQSLIMIRANQCASARNHNLYLPIGSQPIKAYRARAREFEFPSPHMHNEWHSTFFLTIRVSIPVKCVCKILNSSRIDRESESIQPSREPATGSCCNRLNKHTHWARVHVCVCVCVCARSFNLSLCVVARVWSEQSDPNSS